MAYKGHRVGDGRPDFIVGDELIVEVKAVTQLLPVHSAQVLSYLKAKPTELGLLLNFKESTMRRGIKRVVLSARNLQRDEDARDVNKSHEAGTGLVVAGCDAAVSLEVVEEDFNSVA